MSEKSNILRALEMILNRIKAGQLLFYVYESNENFIKLYDEDFMELNEYDFYKRNKNENIYIYLDTEIKKDKEDKEDYLIANLETILKKKIGKTNQIMRLELMLSKYKNYY